MVICFLTNLKLFDQISSDIVLSNPMDFRLFERVGEEGAQLKRHFPFFTQDRLFQAAEIVCDIFSLEEMRLNASRTLDEILSGGEHWVIDFQVSSSGEISTKIILKKAYWVTPSAPIPKCDREIVFHQVFPSFRRAGRFIL